MSYTLTFFHPLGKEKTRALTKNVCWRGGRPMFAWFALFLRGKKKNPNICLKKKTPQILVEKICGKNNVYGNFCYK